MSDSEESGRIDGERIVGLVCIVAALAVGFAWIPLDVESGIVERVRGRQAIGDALAPAAAACLLGLGGLLLLLAPRRGDIPAVPGRDTLGFIVRLALIVLPALLAMRHAGPLTVEALQALGLDLADYRLLRDTPPWSYLGYLAGGTVLVAGLIGLVRHRLDWRILALGFAVALALALAYDLPFDDLLLPPNGDV